MVHEVNTNMYKEFKSAYPNFQNVVEQCKQLADNHGDWDNNPDSQIAIQTDDSSQDNWRAGNGVSVGKTAKWEHTFNQLQPSLVGTPLDEYLRWLGVAVYRARIMLSRPKGCYSVHRDFSPRLHLPLVTNRQCNFLITDPIQFFHLPADGRTTWVDTTKPHTFMNGSTEKRLHLVMIVEK
jgi:hypothetical protein